MTRQCKYCILLKPVAKMIRHSVEKKAFLTTNRIMRDKTHTLPPSPSFRVVPLWFEKGLVLLATLTREEGWFTSTRSWVGQLSPCTVQCCKYFCKSNGCSIEAQTANLVLVGPYKPWKFWGRSNRCVDIFSLCKKTWMPHVTCFLPYLVLP